MDDQVRARWLGRAVLSMTAVALCLGLAAPARAVDGVLEINQACAVNTGCFSGDGAGFPVNISAPGSYRLTSDLTVAAGTAISPPLGVGDVTIDLNGFTIDGAASNGNGIQLSDGDNWEIRNGTVKGFTNGIQQSRISSGHRVIGVRVSDNTGAGIAIANGEGHLIQDCTVTRSVNFPGIVVGSNSRVVGNTVFNNVGTGISMGVGTGYGDNVVNNNGATVSGGVEMGANVCDGNTTCP